MHVDLTNENRDKILSACNATNMSAPYLVNLILAAVNAKELATIANQVRTARPDLLERKPRRRPRIRIILG